MLTLYYNYTLFRPTAMKDLNDTRTTGTVIDREAARLLDFRDHNAVMPSAHDMAEVMQQLSTVIFYEFAPRCEFEEDWLRRLLYDIYISLGEQLQLAYTATGEAEAETRARDNALAFIKYIYELRRLLYTDVKAILHNDPAARSPVEVVASYPAVRALLHYRTAHYLHTLRVPILPRLITELAHSATGIDIHPGAVIGEYFGIDHGTGIVIGETCIIGRHVTIYQGVTLGAKNFEYDTNGNPLNVPRHPIIEDNVTIYSNTSVLGRITVGRGTIIGGNVWLTHSVPAGSRVLQGNAVTDQSHSI